MDRDRPTASGFITELAGRGRYHFTSDEVVRALGVSAVAAGAALRRLKRRGEVADPHRGFHVVVPPEYRRLGCLPADQFVDQLMTFLGEPYHVALLSAAELHGAAHQRPQAFQVMLRKNRRPIECGEVRVQFLARHDLEHAPTIEKKTPRGMLRVASPEATALELVGYADQSGGLDNVAVVVSELVESIDRTKLVEAAQHCPIAWVQRLGYLLDLTEHRDVADALARLVAAKASVTAPLVRSKPRAGAPLLPRWRLVANATVETDL